MTGGAQRTSSESTNGARPFEVSETLTRDRQTVTPEGKRLSAEIEGVRIHVEFVNMPTRPYFHERPDKFRLPRTSAAIPYDL